MQKLRDSKPYDKLACDKLAQPVAKVTKVGEVSLKVLIEDALE